MSGPNQTLQEWLRTPLSEVYTSPSPSSPSCSLLETRMRPQPLYREAIQAVYRQSDLLPIESLKDDAAFWSEYIAAAGGVERSFRSSGTTQSERSLSPFSKQGLDLYRQFSLRGFWAMLQNFFPHPQDALGLSMVPNTSVWPDSSLAQMLAWIGAEGRLTYIDDGAEPLLPQEPIWLFATAFHLVQFADRGQTCRLPAGSIVVETGGTKGRSRSVSREELYELIEASFAVPRNRIVSEYGMCELASQAYDFVPNPDGAELPLSKRRYRFPKWIRLQVADSRGLLKSEGFGSLLVDDRIRCDLPWPIRTEDLVNLNPQGSFELLGRVPLSALKGCSLLAEDCHKRKTLPSATAKIDRLLSPDPATLAARAKILVSTLETIWDMVEHKALLLDLLGSPRLAAALEEDLRRSTPKSVECWVRAALAAIDTETPKSWLIIPPRTHPIAALYPLALGSLLGLDLTVRVSSGSDLLHFWKRELEHSDLVKIDLLPESYRVGDLPAPQVGALLAFASDETLREFKDSSPWPLQGFGSFITASIAHKSALTKGHLADYIWKDTFSLGQKGCMSSRLLFVWGAPEDHLEDWIASEAAFHQAGKNWSEPIPPNEAISLVHTHLDLLRRGQDVLRLGAEFPLIRFCSWSKNTQIDSSLAQRPWILSILAVASGDEADFIDWLSQQTDLQKLSACPSSSDLVNDLAVEICELGAANAPIWNGFHQGRRLFTAGKAQTS